MQLSIAEKLKLTKELSGVRASIKGSSIAEKLKLVKRVGQIRVLLGGKQAEEFDPTTPEGYAKVKDNHELQLAWQDRLDSFFQSRIGAVREAFRALGWEGRQPNEARLYKDFNGNDAEAQFTFKNVGADANIAGYSVNEMTDDLTKTPEQFASEIDAALAVEIASRHSPVVNPEELPQGPSANESDPTEDESYTREDHMAVNESSIIQFIMKHKFESDNQSFEEFMGQFDNPSEVDLDKYELRDFAETAFLVDQAVKENGGSVVWGNFDASAYSGSVFDSAVKLGSKVKETDDPVAGYIAWPGSPGAVPVLPPTPKEIGQFGAGTFRVGAGALGKSSFIVKVDPKSMNLQFLDDDEFKANGDIKWDGPFRLKSLTINKPLFEKAFRGMTFDAVALDSVVFPGSIVGQIADKNGAIVARVRIEENGVLTVFNGKQGLEQVASPTAAVAKINAAIDTVFGGAENKVRVPLPHEQSNTVAQEKDRLRQALVDAYRKDRDATKSLIESIDDSLVVDKKTAEQTIGNIRGKYAEIRAVEDALIEIESAGFDSDDDAFATAGETPESLELVQLKDQYDGIISAIFQKGDDMEAQVKTSQTPAATESHELTDARAKLKKLMDLQDRMKAANKVVKNKKLSDDQKIEQLIGQGFAEAVARELLKPDFAGRIGFADYELTNNNAKIKNTQKRVEELQARETAKNRAASGNGQTTFEFEDGTVELNYDEDRLQVFFSGKPDSSVRDKLKSNGFKWSPTNVTWQRQLTDNAISTANYLFGTKIPSAASMMDDQQTKQPEPAPTPMVNTTETQDNPMKAAFEAELNTLKLETDINAFNDKLDDIAGRIEAAGLMEEMDGILNEVADKLTELLAEAETA